MSKKFNHAHIIKKYSKNFEFKRREKGKIVAGRPVEKEIIFTGKAAIMRIDPNSLEDASSFVTGDMKAYFVKKQEYQPKINDTFSLAGKEYILKKEFNNDLADYTQFLARRVVTGGIND